MHYKSKENRLLIIQLKNGEEQAFTSLIDLFHRNLCVYANSLLNDTSLAEDIVQNVFIKVWEKRKNLKEEYSIKKFLYKSVYNEFIDYYRKHKHVIISIEQKHINLLTHMLDDNTNDTTEDLIKNVKLEIKQLPPKYKHTFLLSKKEGLSNNEISEYLGISIKTVESHITKAFSIIRNNINSKKGPILS